MIGRRSPSIEIGYPVSDLALRHGAGVKTEAHHPEKAYADVEKPEHIATPWPL